MINNIIKDFDRDTVICIIVTAIILWFYNNLISYIYLIGLILVMIIRFKWNILNITKIKNALKNVALSVITIFFITNVGEIWLHLYPHRFTGIGGIDIVGDFSDYASRGYLTEEIFQKKPDVVRILGLGDSFARYWWEKGKNYHSFLQAKYLATDKGTVEIVNAGMESIGPGYYWHILNKYGDSFKPDVVLVSFFIGNDFHEAELFISIGNFISEPKDLTKKYSEYYQFRKWRLFKLLRNKYIHFREDQRKKQEVKSLPPKQIGIFSQDTFLELERDTIWMFEENGKKELHQKWHECSDIILKMKDWCDRRKINLVIFISPDQIQVDQELRKLVLTRYKKLTEKDLNLSYPNNLIVNFCREHNINCLDLLGPFQEQGKIERLYTLNDTHWNEAGNRLAAEKIFEYLEAHNLVPARPGQ